MRLVRLRLGCLAVLLAQTRPISRPSPARMRRLLAFSLVTALVAACGSTTLSPATNTSPSPSPSPTPTVALPSESVPSAPGGASPVPISRDQAIAIARRFGVGTNGIVQAEAGPFRQFEPDPNPKISPPPPDQWVWRIRFVGPVSTSFVILDYYTGQFVESGIATP
jgi:hypothetical protein